ncbi:integrase arm-type DNA-binding domain-containing protein [Sphingomonas sp. T9W2]|uniref:tyrosine-type recombinase/integrase n=1 Tax=Sphingomonas sp. T9W2 TaxID=3143183 RepID=UPI0031F58A59
MPLTAAQARSAAPTEKAYKLADGGGLYLWVSPTGAKSWRMKYRYGGKEKVLTFGLYGDVSLAEAREMREAAKRTLRANKDPAIEARLEKHRAVAAAGSTFEASARAWHADEQARWSAGQSTLVVRALERDVFPEIGKLPIAEIDGPTVLRMLRKVERRGAIETAKRIRGYVSAVFVRAKGEHLVTSNPAAEIGRALKPTPRGAKQPAITDLPGLLELQLAVERSTAGLLVKHASRLLALTGVRVGVLRTALWSEFSGIDWEAPDAPAPDATWRIPAERMKLDVEAKDDEAFDHDVPLPPQAVAVLHALRPLSGRLALLFPSAKATRLPMSDAAISTAYKRLGYKGRHVPHGWRAAFSTIMNEWTIEHGREGDRLMVDLMLAHRPAGMSGSEFAYNRAKYSKRRRELAAIWADMITDGLPPPRLPSRES